MNEFDVLLKIYYLIEDGQEKMLILIIIINDKVIWFWKIIIYNIIPFCSERSWGVSTGGGGTEVSCVPCCKIKESKKTRTEGHW